MDRTDAGPNGPAVPSLRSVSPIIRVAVVAVVVVLALISLGVYVGEYSGDERFTKDFALDYVSARAVLDGRDPYTPIDELIAGYLHPPQEVLNDVLPGANWHPPFKVLLTLPLALLPYRAAGITWLMLSALAYVAAGMLLGSALGWRRSSGLLLGLGALIVPVVQKDLSTGNLNGELLLVLVAAWHFARKGNDAAAGVAIGLAAAIKVFPALILLPFLVSRRWRVVTYAGAAGALLTVIGVVALGPADALDHIRAGTGSEGFGYWDASPANIGWWGLATRWLSPNGWVPHLSLGALGLVLAVGGIVVFLALAARPRAEFTEDTFWATVPLMLLAWPIVWDHYLVLMLPWVVLGARRIPRSRNRAIWFALISLPILVGLLPGGPSLAELEPWRAATIFQLPTLALIGAVVLERLPASARRQRDKPAGRVRVGA